MLLTALHVSALGGHSGVRGTNQRQVSVVLAKDDTGCGEIG